MQPESPPPITLSSSEAQLTRSVNARRARRMPRVPFYPVPTRSRQFTLSACLAGSRRGWTVKRQADFLGYLAETGSVAGACEAVGMSRKSAYALRARPGAESLAAAWDVALGLPVRKVTVDDLHFVAFEGLVRLRFFRSRYRGSSQVTDKSALLRFVAKLDRMTRECGDPFER